ncbi:MAG TPA: ribose-phosphate pyrophosphokinase [Chitinophagaceae bacterium]
MSFQLFALNDSQDFGARVARAAGVPLSPHEENDFEDGEHEARPLESVRNGEVFVIQSLYAGNEHSINDKLCRLLFFIGALKDASARRVTAVLPYLGYARKDQKSESRGPVTTRYMASLLEAVGTDHIVTIDVHNIPAYQNAFRLPTENLEARHLFIDYLAPRLQGEEIVVMSPDIGGVKRAERFQKTLSKRLQRDIPLAFKEKYRKEGAVSGDAIIGDVKGKLVIIEDDMISTGTTLSRSVRACAAAGVKGVIAAATHGLFSSKAPEVLADDILQEIIVTNTVPPFRLEGTSVMQKTTVLDAAPLFGEAIRRMHGGGSLTNLVQD